MQLSTADVVDAEEGADGIDDEQPVLARCKVLAQLGEKLLLQLAVLRTGDGDVLDSSLSVDTEAICDLDDSLRAERAFCIY